MFKDPGDYPAVNALSEHWRTIRAELAALEQRRFMAWPEADIFRGDWTVFPLYKFGRRVDENCELCPVTTAAIEKIPGMITAGFSSLAPGTYIGPHTGYTSEVLRVHLALVGTDGCALRVGSETRSWTPGDVWVFDDTTEHEAWNRGTETRVVLLLDFQVDPKAPSPYPEHVYTY